MMETLAAYIVPAAAGIILGFAYFGGLWLTMQALPSTRHPALLVIGSYLSRLAMAFASLLAIALLGGWKPLLVSMGGFLLVKVVLAWSLGPYRKTMGYLEARPAGTGGLEEVEDGNQS